MLKFIDGDLFEHPADILVNPVNCVGVMGKGIAKEFKKRYPEMFVEYKEACDKGYLKPGTLYIYIDDYEGKVIINFATKNHWKSSSEYRWIETGLEELREYLLNHKYNSICIPALGCANGGLDWDRVKPLIEKYLSDLPQEITVFNPK